MFNPFIKTFIEVANCKSFSSASEKLYISKVSIMNQINSLEKLLGTPLFERTHQGVKLTSAGENFYKNILKIISLSENAINEAKEIGNLTTQTINIGTSIMRPCNYFIESLSNKNIKYKFNIIPFNDDSNNLNIMLKSLGDKIDCFISPFGSEELKENYGTLLISNCKCCIAMPRNHILAKKKSLQIEDLYGESLLLIKKGKSYIIDEIRDDLQHNHPKINIIDFDNYYDISTFNLCEKNGYLMETLDIWKNLHPSLKTISINWKYKIPYGIIYQKEPTKKVKNFIEDISCILF